MFTAKLNRLQFREKSFINDPLNIAGLGLSLIINIIHWVLLYFKLGHSTGTIILHYNLVYGPDLVDKVKYAYMIPAIALVLLIINAICARFFYRKEKLAGYFLNFSNIAIQLIFLAASITVIMIND